MVKGLSFGSISRFQVVRSASNVCVSHSPGELADLREPVKIGHLQIRCVRIDSEVLLHLGYL